ncbi:ABC transporter permease [Methylocapsa sp. S129]|uniref:ABC transporter permease n=1 Tax=Methylocapsa sp. S129 TaxID=1641869 RepID=UPI00131BBF76|nr:ABC transporter permease [Methylocapsa sp. S129]
MSVDSNAAPVAAARPARETRDVGRILRRYAIFIVLAALLVLFQSVEPAFLRVNNLFSVLQSVAVVALLGIGVTVTLAVDGFDLSVGSTAAFTLMLSSYAMVVLQLGAVPTVGLALLGGAAIGLINGFLIVGLRIPDLLATLGMMFLLSGLQLIPSGGRSISTGVILPNGSAAAGSFDPAFLLIGRYRLWDLAPLPVVIVAIIALIAWFVMERTRWGRVFYAVGGNEAAAHLAGAPVKTYRLAAYVVSGILAALGGVFIAARVGRGDVFAGSSLLLDSVAAALIGFAVLDKRHANVLGAVTGAVFVGIVLNGLTMLNVPYYTQDFVKGIVLVGALAITFGIGRGRR